MKFWKINNEENEYLIVSEKMIATAKFENEEDLQKLVDNNDMTDLPVHYLEEIKDFVFVDTDKELGVNFRSSKKSDIEFNIDEGVYNEIKTFFIENIKEIEIKDYSMLRQLKIPVFGTLIFGVLFWFLHSVAVSLQNGETVRIQGRGGFIKRIIIWVADLLGPTAILIIGSLLMILFIYIIITTIIKPKQGNVVKIKRTSKIAL